MQKTIENIWYKLNEKKKRRIIAITFVFIILLFISTVKPVYSADDAKWDWTHPFSSLINKVASNVTDELTNITDEINVSVIQGVTGASDMFTESIFGQFANPLTNFEDSEDTGLSSDSFENTVGTTFVKKINTTTASIGYFVATILFFFGIFVYFFSGKISDTKDTPISLIGKYVISIFLIISASNLSIRNTINDYLGKFCTSLTGIENNNPLSFNAFITEGTGGADINLCGLILKLPKAIPFIMTIFSLGGMIVMLIIVKNAFKMYIECISRYIISNVLLLLFGAFCGTIVSNNTSNIFKSYIQTLFSSYFLLAFDLVWFSSVIGILLTRATGLGKGNTLGLMEIILINELLKLGPKFDGILKGMGIGVAQGMSRVGSSIGMGINQLARSLSNANQLRKGAGTTLQALAGNPSLGFSPETRQKMYETGSKMAAPLSTMVGGQNVNDPNKIVGMLQDSAKKGKILPDSYYSNAQAGNVLDRMMKNPGKKDLSEAIGGMSETKKAEGMQELLGGGMQINEAMRGNYKGVDGYSHEGIRVSGTMADGTQFSGVIGSERYMDSSKAMAIPGSETNGLLIQMDNNMKMMESQNFNNAFEAGTFAGSEAANVLNNLQGNIKDNIADGGRLEYAGKTSDGDAFRLYGKDDNGNEQLMGSIIGDKFAPTINNMSGQESTAFLNGVAENAGKQAFGEGQYEWKTNAEGNIFAKDPKDQSKLVGTIVGQDSNGYEVEQKVTLIDKGANPTAELPKGTAANSNNNKYEMPIEAANHDKNANTQVYAVWSNTSEKGQVPGMAVDPSSKQETPIDKGSNPTAELPQGPNAASKTPDAGPSPIDVSEKGPTPGMTDPSSGPKVGIGTTLETPDAGNQTINASDPSWMPPEPLSGEHRENGLDQLKGAGKNTGNNNNDRPPKKKKNKRP